MSSCFKLRCSGKREGVEAYRAIGAGPNSGNDRHREYGVAGGVAAARGRRLAFAAHKPAAELTVTEGVIEKVAPAGNVKVIRKLPAVDAAVVVGVVNTTPETGTVIAPAEPVTACVA